MIFRFSTPQKVIITVYVLGGRTTKIYPQDFLKPCVISIAGIWDNFAYILQSRNTKKKTVNVKTLPLVRRIQRRTNSTEINEVIRFEDAYTELTNSK